MLLRARHHAESRLPLLHAMLAAVAGGSTGQRATPICSYLCLVRFPLCCTTRTSAVPLTLSSLPAPEPLHSMPLVKKDMTFLAFTEAAFVPFSCLRWSSLPLFQLIPQNAAFSTHILSSRASAETGLLEQCFLLPVIGQGIKRIS